MSHEHQVGTPNDAIDYNHFIEQRRVRREPAMLFKPSLEDVEKIADMLAAGGLVVLPWYQKGKSTLFLATSHDNAHSTRRLNEVKGRSPTQTLGLSYHPDSVNQVAEITSSKPLLRAAERLQTDLIGVLNECYKESVGLLFMAKGQLPEAVTMQTERGKTVLLMGAINEEMEFDLYNAVLDTLYKKHGKAIAGSSANKIGKNVYGLSEQEEAYQEFMHDADGFVVFDSIPIESLNPTRSSTLIDLTGDLPKVVREGSVGYAELKHIFPDLKGTNGNLRKSNIAGRVSSLIHILHRKQH